MSTKGDAVTDLEPGDLEAEFGMVTAVRLQLVSDRTFILAAYEGITISDSTEVYQRPRIKTAITLQPKPGRAPFFE